jgi:hypothetical protein
VTTALFVRGGAAARRHPLVAGVALGAGLAVLARQLRLRCLLRGRHNPARLRMGLIGLSGFACLDCPKKGATYSEMGFEKDGDHVSRVARNEQAEGSRW